MIMKTKQFFTRLMAGAMMMLTGSLMTSCGLFEDNPVVEEVVETIVEETGASAEEVTAIISQLLTTPEIQQAIANGDDVEITVAGGFSTSGETTTITIPQTGSGSSDGANIVLTFEEAVTTSATTPLAFTAETGADGESGESNNTLEIAMPASTTPLYITIELPNTTVTLSAPGTGTVYQTIVAKTATETLYVGNKVTVEELRVAGGSVRVQDGGVINTYIYPTGRVITNKDGYQRDTITFNQDGKVIPSYIKIDNDLVCEVRDKDGNPYYFDYLKVVSDGDKTVANVFFDYCDPIKKLTIGKGTTANTDEFRGFEVEGEDGAKLVTWQTWWVNKYTNVELNSSPDMDDHSIIVHSTPDGLITFNKVSLGEGTRLFLELDEVYDAFEQTYHPQDGVAQSILHYTITINNCAFNLLGIDLFTLESSFNMEHIEKLIGHIFWDDIMAKPNPIDFLNILLKEAITFVIDGTEYQMKYAIDSDTSVHSLTLVPIE